MDDAWDISPTTGDQCALCEAPLDERSTLMEAEGGTLLKVCSACALRFTGPGAEPAPSPPSGDRVSPVDPAEVQQELRALIDTKAHERDLLDKALLMLDSLVNDLTFWQSEAAQLEKRLHAATGELSRTRERLQRTEAVLAASGTVSAAEETLPAPGRTPAETIPAAASPQEPATPTEEGAFTVEDLRAIQRYFNESGHTDKMKSVRRSLGRPVVNVAPVRTAEKAALVTVAWEIVWYQFLVELQPVQGEAEPTERVTLFAEGMELTELSEAFRQPTAMLDDQGRLDASEMEVSVLSGEEGTLLSTMSEEDEAALEDATEEIWDRHSLPEFRWDD